MAESNFHRLIKGSASVDLVSLFDIAARLTGAEKSSYDRYSSSVQESFNKHLDFISGKVLEAIRVSLEDDGLCDPEEDNGQESPDAKD